MIYDKLLVTRIDKGNVTVILNRADYVADEMAVILLDSNIRE